MTEIIIKNEAPTIETVGHQGQLYIHQRQRGRRLFYGDLYICNLVHKYVNGPQDKDTVHYYWEKILPSKELEEKISKINADLLNEIDSSVNYNDLSKEEFVVDENNQISINLIPESKVECLTENFDDIYENGVFAQDLFKGEFQVNRNSVTGTISSIKINKISKDKISNLEEAINPEIKVVPIENVLSNNVEYRLFHMGKMSKLDFKLPETIPNVFSGKIFIRSADAGLQLNIDNVIFMGEDCENGKFNSKSSKYYEIKYKNVGCCDELYNINQNIIVAEVAVLPIN